MIILLRNMYFKMISISWKLLLVSAVLLISFCTIMLPIIEPQTFKTHMDALWLTMTAMPTIGYGDLSAHTTVGRIFSIVFIHIIGVGLFTTLVAKLIEGVVSYKTKKEGGLLEYNREGHIVIIDWSYKAEHAVKELLKKDKKQEVVVIDTLDKLEHVNGHVHYVKGEPSKRAVLEMANISKARAVFIFSDDRIESKTLKDGKSLIVATAIEHIAHNVHTTVEIEREEHVELFEHIKVDKFILSNQTLAKMVVDSLN